MLTLVGFGCKCFSVFLAPKMGQEIRKLEEINVKDICKLYYMFSGKKRCKDKNCTLFGKNIVL